MTTLDTVFALNPNIGVYYEKQNKLRFHFVFYATSTHKVFDVEKYVPKLLSYIFYGYKDLSELINLLIKEYPKLTKSKIYEVVKILSEENIIYKKDDTTLNKFKKKELEFYDRQLNFWIDYSNDKLSSLEIQNNLKKSKVTILGIGGTGSWICQQLAMAGVGKLKIVDFDTIAIHNLTRQTLYNFNDVNKKKIVTAKEKLLYINPFIEVETVDSQLRQDTNNKELISDSDLVINCADYPNINTTSTWISEICMKLKIPHIVGGGYIGHIGLIGPTIIPGETACWNCFQMESKKGHEQDLINLFNIKKRTSGVIAPISSIIASIQTLDALRILGKFSKPININRKGELDYNTLKIKWKYVYPNKDCDWCKAL